MSERDITIPCHECGEQFNPYLNKKKGWTCPNCKTQQPNLDLHYRLIAYLCAGALLWAIFSLSMNIMNVGHLDSVHWVPAAQCLGLLVIITLITFLNDPWRNNILTSLVCLIYGSFLFSHLLAPILLILALGISPQPDLLRFLVLFGSLLLMMGMYLGWTYIAVRRLQLASA